MSKKKQEGVATFPKSSILASRKYSAYKDVLNAILEDGKEYTYADIDASINKFLTMKVR